MNEPLQTLYEAISGKYIFENPLTSTEIEMRTKRLHDFFKAANAQEQDDAFMTLYSLGQKKAFEAGFYTALELLLK